MTTGPTSSATISPGVPPSGPTPAIKEIGRGPKLAFGVGAVADQLGLQGPSTMAAPLLNISLGVNPLLVGTILGAVRIWDAIVNPIMGAISDNSSSRFGRRRPFIVGGAVASGLAFFLLWCLPHGLTPNGYAMLFTVASLFFYTAFTVYSVPYHALGYELSPSYHGRTQVMAYRMVFNIVGSVMVGWLFPATQWSGFKDAFSGMFWVGAACGITIMVTGVIVGVYARGGRVPESKPVKVNPYQSLRYSLSNRTFCQVAAVALLILVSTAVFQSLSLYVNIYYVHHGRVGDAAVVQGTASTVGVLVTFLSVPIWTALTRRIGKISVLKIGSALIFVGSLLQFVVFSPDFRWLQTVAYIVVYPGTIAAWLTIHAMIGDICDSDELRTGVRREGMYGAILSWMQRIGISISAVLVGAVLAWSGFDKTLGGAQSASAILILRMFFVTAPAVAALGAIFIVSRYSLTEAAVMRIQADLAALKKIAR